MPKLNIKSDILTLQEAAIYLRLSEMTVLRLANKGFLPGAKIGGRWRFSKDCMLELIKRPELMRQIKKIK